MTRQRRPQVLLIDLDDTLYETPEMARDCAANIRRYMVERLGVAASEVEERCLELYLNYGTTLAGLVANGYRIDFNDWHAFVHGTIPYEKYLKRDPKLRALLDSIDLPKYVFTNADRQHAECCLRLLGLAECFQGIICFENTQEAAERRGWVHHGRPVVCKPQRQAFDIALQLAGGVDPSCALFFDDSTRNVTSAQHMGVRSVLVGRTGVDCTCELQLRSMHDLPGVLPVLLGMDGNGSSSGGDDTLRDADGQGLGAQDEGFKGGALASTVYVQA